MSALIYLMTVSVLLAEYLQLTYDLPSLMRLLPEACSLIAALVVVLQMQGRNLGKVDARYLFVFGLIVVGMLLGVVLNQLSPGTAVSGTRTYFKAMPFFLLPLLVPIDDKTLRRQLALVASICILQLPIAWEQRGRTVEVGATTGDWTTGTLDGSAFMTMLLSCSAAIAMAMYLRGHLTFRRFALFLVLTLPATMINETKATLFLVPVSLLVPALFLLKEAGSAPKLKRVVLPIALLATFVAVFIPVYDYYMAPRWGYGLLDFFEMDDRVERYLIRDSTIGSTDSGKLDSLLLPFQAARHDFTQVVIGLGIGNVSESSFGPGFTGANFARYGHLMGPTTALLLWEIGLFGAVLVFVIFYMIYRDSLLARRAPGIRGDLALGWLGVLVVMFIGMFYKNTINSNALSYLFWFYSGVVVATATSVRRQSAAAHKRVPLSQPVEHAPEPAFQRARPPALEVTRQVTDSSQFRSNRTS